MYAIFFLFHSCVCVFALQQTMCSSCGHSSGEKKNYAIAWEKIKSETDSLDGFFVILVVVELF